MVYLKNSKREKGLAIQIAAISRYMQPRLNLEITSNHIEQQLRGAFDVPKLKNKPMDIARSLAKMSAVFIDYNKIKDNEYLREIWDASLEFLGEHISELKKMKDDPMAKFSMSDSILRKLIEEMDESYGSAEFFNTDSYSKELPESEQDAF